MSTLEPTSVMATEQTSERAVPKTVAAILRASETERLRQERETFNQTKTHDRLWFVLRLCMGYVGLLALIFVAVVCGYIVVNVEVFGRNLALGALAVLGGDLLVLIGTIWRLVLSPKSAVALAPVTSIDREPRGRG